MTRHSILVVGADSTLGRALLEKLGPTIAIAATRTGTSPLPGFEHTVLGIDGTPPTDVLRRCRAVINSEECFRGAAATLDATNAELPPVIARAAAAAGVSKMVQVSSFSVAGAAEQIDKNTLERPTNAYGRSKATADRALMAILSEGFAIECLRLPFMFSASKPGLLSTLLSLSDRFGILPNRADRPFQRSMITYEDAARTLIACTEDTRSGRSYAADPRLFDYSLLTEVLAEEARRNVRVVAVPKSLAAVVEHTLPAIGRRLFRSSILDPGNNRAGEIPLGLDQELRLLVKARYRQ